MKKLFLAAAAILGVYALAVTLHTGNSPVIPEQHAAQHDDALAEAFKNRSSNVQVSGEGTVLRILPDDNNGSRHQRFILKLASGQTLLVAHNIDLAPRIPSLSTGDTVRFHGEYEWNEKGGVLHWTHHDPNGSHPGGWLEHQNKRYQ